MSAQPGGRKRRRVNTFALQYVPGSNLAVRFPGPASGRFRTRKEAENIRAHCVNAEHIEVVDTRATA